MTYTHHGQNGILVCLLSAINSRITCDNRDNVMVMWIKYTIKTDIAIIQQSAGPLREHCLRRKPESMIRLGEGGEWTNEKIGRVVERAKERKEANRKGKVSRFHSMKAAESGAIC